MTASVWRPRAYAAAAWFEPLHLAAWIALLAGLALTAWAYATPRYETVTEPVPWQVQAAWMYTAPVPATLAEDERLPWGAPLYREVTPQVTVTFTARLNTDAPATDLRSQARLWARIEDDYGWYRTWDLATTRGQGGHVELTGALDLDQVERLLRQRERALPPARRYTLRVGVTAHWAGQLAGQPWETTADSALAFRREAPGLYVLQRSPASPDEDGDLAAPRWEGVLERTVQVPRQMGLGPWQAPVARWRVWGLGLSGLGLVVLVALQAGLAWVRPRWPEVYFRAWAGGRGVEVQPGPWLDAVASRWTSASPEAVLRLADQWDEPVLLVRTDAALHLLVRLPDAVYGYREPWPAPPTVTADAALAEAAAAADETTAPEEGTDATRA